MITKEEVLDIQKQWSDGLLKIVSKHQENKDYIIEASNFIDRLYAYDSSKVLFKPTLASDIQFRKTKESALSYFIAGNSNFREDDGFALKGWESVRWENTGIQVFDNIAIAMGNYYFKNADGNLKVEFSFVYKKDDCGSIKIILHDSHLPYQK
ncbi:MAG: phosphoribosyl-AMP cyclohydrolase [Flavobacteriales bacterium]|nr:phosphoribosyl-AMP cyclohydrolase [Flavobacteriales bacterium]|tara:strand:+ start:16674 stop:17132 length:459 start_codon:yes stop_codon:yes gene_type:complete